MKTIPFDKKKQPSNFEKHQREFHHELKKLREFKKFGPLLDRSTVQIALTKFEDKVVYIKANNLNQLDFWDLKTHRLLHCFEDAHQGSIHSMTITLKQNYLISGSADTTIAIWDLEQKKLYHRFDAAHKSIVTSIVTSTTDKMIAASTSLDRSIAIWDLVKKKLVCRFTNAHTTDIHALAMTTDGEFLVSSGDQMIAVWDISKKDIHRRLLDAHFSWIYCVTITADNQHIASGSADGKIKIWDLRSGLFVDEFENSNSAEVWSITTSVADPQKLIFGSEDGSISTWTMQGSDNAPKKISNEESKEPICWLFSSSVTGDNTIISACLDGKILVWDLNNEGKPIKQLIPHHVSNHKGLQLTSDSKLLIFLRPKNLYVWNFHQRKLIHIFSIEENEKMLVMTLASDDRTVLVAFDDYTIRFVDLNSFLFGDTIKVSHESSKLDYPLVAITNSRKNIIYTAKSEKYITIFDFESRKEIQKFEENKVKAITISKDSRYLVTGNDSFTFSVWDLVEMKLHQRYNDPNKHESSMRVMLTPDDKYLMTINTLKSEGLKIWDYKDTTTDKPFKQLKIPDLSSFASIVAGDLLIWTGRIDFGNKYLNYQEYLSGAKPYSDEKLHGTELSHRNIHLSSGYLTVSKDNKYLISETYLGLEVWDLINLTLYYEINELGTYFTGNNVCISKDSKFLTCLTRNNDIEVWNSDRNMLEHRFYQKAHHMPMICLTFSPNYKYMVTGCSAGLIVIWDLEKKEVTSKIPSAHCNVIKKLLITDDNTKIISLSEFEILIWDLLTCKRLHSVSHSNTHKRYLSMAYSKNSEDLIISQGKDITLLNITTQKQHHIKDAHNGDINAATVTPKLIISGSTDGSVAFWEIESRKLLRRLDGIHKGSVTSLCWNGKYVFSASSDGSIGVIELEQMVLKYREKSLNEKSIKFMTLTPKHHFLVYLSNNGHIGYLKLKQKIFNFKYKTEDKFFSDCLAVTSENNFLIAGKTEGTIFVWNLHTNHLIWKNDKAHSGWIRQITAIENSNYFVSAADDGSVAVWNIEEKILHHRFEVAQFRTINGLTVIPKTNFVIAGDGSNRITVLDALNKETVIQLSDAHKTAVFHVAVSSDGKKIASVGNDSKVALWERDGNNNLKEHTKFEYPHSDRVVFVAITPDNQRIIASNNKTIQIWRMNQSVYDPPEELITKKGMHPEDFHLSKDGRYFSAVSQLDKSIYIWNLHKKNCFFHLRHKKFEKIRKMVFSDDFRYIFCVVGTDIAKIKTSFVTNNEDLQVNKIPTLYAIDCLLNPSEYTKKEFTEASRALSQYYYLPKGWDFLYFIAFMLPNVDSFLIDAAIQNEITISFDSAGNTPLDYLLEFQGQRSQHLQKFFAYFFSNVSSLIDLKVLDAENMLLALSRGLSKIQQTQTETSFLSYLSCFSLKTEGILFNSQKLPLQGELIGWQFIELTELTYKEKEIRRAVKQEGKDTLTYHLVALPLSHKIHFPDSLEFIRMMSSSSNISFYETPIVRHLVDFYWQKSKKYLWLWIVFHLILIGLFTAFAIIREANHSVASGLLIPVVVINSILFICEVLQILSNFKYYRQDPYNFMDILIISVQFVTAGIFWSDVSHETLSFFVSLSTLLWYTKLLALLRIIDQLRKFIRMIFEIVRDAASFGFVIFTYIVAFTILMYQSRNSDPDNDPDFWSVALEMYTFAIGNYDPTRYSGVTMPFFILGSIFMPVILLNMLIALMSHAYDRANEKSLSIDTKEKISMISEIASIVSQILRLIHLFFCRKGRLIPKQYLLVVEPFEDSDDNVVPFEDKITHLARGIETAVLALKTDFTQLELSQKSSELKLNQHNELLKSVNKKLESQMENFIRNTSIKVGNENEVKDDIKKEPEMKAEEKSKIEEKKL